jgi:hypothetical protein
MSEGGSIQAMLTAMKDNARRRKTGNKSIMGMESRSLYKEGIKQREYLKAHIEAIKTMYRAKSEEKEPKASQSIDAVLIVTPILCYGIF